ncbi:MAG TPA: hypothetical protein VFA61_06950 [Candidatus Udaeobacter sp.]|nr:hypothetical protein [Candidatus Udaeobacter sp.]
MPVRFRFDETLDVGEETGTPMGEDYDVPFKFTGQINKVVVKLGAPQLTAINRRALITTEPKYHAREKVI